MKIIRVGLPFLLALAAAAVAHAAPPFLPAAEALVRAQYAPAADASSDAAARLYVPELGKALMEVSTANGADLEFDPRYGDKDWTAQDLTLTTTPAADGAKVTVRFRSFGKPMQIDWLLTPSPDGPDGWRVKDISAPAQAGQTAWDLRDLLQLDAKP